MCISFKVFALYQALCDQHMFLESVPFYLISIPLTFIQGNLDGLLTNVLSPIIITFGESPSGTSNLSLLGLSHHIQTQFMCVQNSNTI